MLAMAAGITVFPLALIGISFLLDEGTEDRMRHRVAVGAADVASLLERDGRVEAARLDAVAEEHAVRIRVIAEDTTDEADHDASRLAGVFFGDDGGTTLRELDATLGPVLARPEALAARELPTVGCRTAPDGRLSVCHAVSRVTGADGPVLIYVQESSRRSIRALFDLRYQLLKLTLVVLPLSLLLAWWLGRRFVLPIEQLRARVREHGRAGRAAPIALDRHDELGELADAFDQLVGKLDTRARSTEAFLADVAHELKSPVATVLACAETLEDQELDPARAARLSRALLASARRMEGLLSRLLELARAEAGMPEAEREPVALPALLRDVLDEASVRYPEVRFELELMGEPAPLLGVSEALCGAMRNLIDNAASFGRRVSVTVDAEADPARITVADDGPGIASHDLPRVFDRFFTTRPRSEGTGLGLPYVRAVAEAHGGSVTASSEAGRGARFVMELPVELRDDSHPFHTSSTPRPHPPRRLRGGGAHEHDEDHVPRPVRPDLRA